MGLDFGTNSVRCLIADTTDGRELGSCICEYETGREGIILDSADHNLARQNPADYLKAVPPAVAGAVEQAKKADKSFDLRQIIGIGVDTTGSTPLPVDRECKPLSGRREFSNNPNAAAWLWKDHTAHAEAAEITELARKEHPEYLVKCGGTYSSEWFFSKILHCLRVDPDVFEAAYTWLELADYIPAVLTGMTTPERIKRSRCAAGHKAMFNSAWAGLPGRRFLAKLDPKLAELRDRLYDSTYTCDEPAGKLATGWARRLGLAAGIPVAVGALDAHMGAVGAGIAPGKLVKIIGTSTCDMLVWPADEKLPDIPGICGIVEGSILPHYFGLEAGQSAVGDIFSWFVNYLRPGGNLRGSHKALTAKATKLMPGQSGLMALDWNNGNRTILVDQRLTGLVVGLTLHTKPEEIYRALIEATAFGALTIINRFEEYGLQVQEVINCGGVAEKNPLLMQIYADVTGREMKISRCAQACALGAAIAAAVVAGKGRGGYDNFPQAQTAMCGVKDKTYEPIPKNYEMYRRLYALYKQLHDAFGLESFSGSLFNVMKQLLAMKDQTAS
jgi:L-ribulokinase